VNRLPALLTLLFLSGFITSCSTTAIIDERDDYRESPLSPDSLYQLVSDYSGTLLRISGKGRAIVSQKNGSDRVTIEFHSNREASLLNIRSGVGIEGGQVLVKDDSVLVYNKVDKYARKVPLSEGGGSDIGSLASVNIIELLDFTVKKNEITEVLENENFYVGILGDKGRFFLEKETGFVREVVWHQDSPYRQIIYEGYANLDGFELPRKITIFSADGNSKVLFLVQNLNVNSILPELTIDLPDNIPVTRI
jgi:hypothetical protein